MKTNSKKIVAIVSLICVVAAGIFFIRSRTSGTKPIDPKLFREEQQKKDFEALNNPQAPATEVFGAMIRAAQLRKPIARNVALASAKHAEPLMRIGAARALGYFEDQEALEALQALCKDENVKVRRSCIMGLAAIKTPERKKLLGETFAKNNSDKEEQLLAMIELVRFETQPAARSEALKNTLTFATSSGDRKLESLAVSRIAGLAPRDPAVTSQLQKVLENPVAFSPSLQMLATRHLGSQRHPWILKNYDQLITSKAPLARLAAVQTMPVICPSNRWTLLEKIVLEDSDLKVRKEALKVLSLMPTEDARVLIERLLESPKLPAASLDDAKKSAKALANNKSVDPCLGKN